MSSLYVNITLKTLTGDLLQIAVDPYDTLKTVAQKLVMSGDSMFRCATFVRIARLNKEDKDEKEGIDAEVAKDSEEKSRVATLPWSEGEMAAVFYDPQPKSYYIHDNGGIPFIVDVTDDTIYVYFSDFADENSIKGQLVLETPYKKVWVGDNDLNLDHYTQEDKYAGNSILIQIPEDCSSEDVGGSTYMYIGSEIYTFRAEEGDHINMFFSPIGRNDVPYPYAIGERMAYFMLDRKAVSVDVINVNGDAYRQFYDIEDENEYYKNEDENDDNKDENYKIHDFKSVEQVKKRI